MPPRGKSGRTSASSSFEESLPPMAESKTEREEEESYTEGSQDTESMPRDRGLFSSSSSVMKSWVFSRQKLYMLLGGGKVGCFMDAVNEA